MIIDSVLRWDATRYIQVRQIRRGFHKLLCGVPDMVDEILAARRFVVFDTIECGCWFCSCRNRRTIDFLNSHRVGVDLNV